MFLNSARVGVDRYKSGGGDQLTHNQGLTILSLSPNELVCIVLLWVGQFPLMLNSYTGSTWWDLAGQIVQACRILGLMHLGFYQSWSHARCRYHNMMLLPCSSIPRILPLLAQCWYIQCKPENHSHVQTSGWRHSLWLTWNRPVM